VAVLLQIFSSDSEIVLKIGQYLMKLRRMKLTRTKKSVPVFWASLYIYFMSHSNVQKETLGRNRDGNMHEKNNKICKIQSCDVFAVTAADGSFMLREYF